jgi:hypothetical protein
MSRNPDPLVIEFTRTINLIDASVDLTCTRNDKVEFIWNHLKREIQPELHTFVNFIKLLPDRISTAILINQLGREEAISGSKEINEFIDQIRNCFSVESKLKYAGLNNSLSKLVRQLELLSEGLDSWNLFEVYFTAGLIVDDLDLLHTGARIFESQLQDVLKDLEAITLPRERQGGGEVRTTSRIELRDPQLIKEVLSLKTQFYDVEEYEYFLLTNIY